MEPIIVCGSMSSGCWEAAPRLCSTHNWCLSRTQVLAGWLAPDAFLRTWMLNSCVRSKDLFFEIWYHSQRSFVCWLRKPTITWYLTRDHAGGGRSDGMIKLLVRPWFPSLFFPTLHPSDDVHDWVGHTLIDSATWSENLLCLNRCWRCTGKCDPIFQLGSRCCVSCTACHLCLCIWYPLCHGVCSGTVSNFIMDTRYQALLLFVVRDRDEALEIPPQLLLVG